MRVAKDTTLRYLAMLQLIPVKPASISARQLREKLCSGDRVEKVNIRTVQRDLEKLSDIFPITCDEIGRANKWYWISNHAITQIPAMSKPQALAFKLASEYLKPLMPPSTLRYLEPYFKHANNILNESKLGKWATRVRIITSGPTLIPPIVNKNVQEIVYQSLLEEKQIEVTYKSKWADVGKPYKLNPLGIVFRDGVIYLVATLWDYEEPRHFVLHRMSKPKLLGTTSKQLAGFNLKHHIEEDKEFSYPVSKKKIKLRALFSNNAAFHLTELKLSDDQKSKEQDDDRVFVTATVDDTDELRWWILSFGDQVEILSPKTLRRDIANTCNNMSDKYN